MRNAIVLGCNSISLAVIEALRREDVGVLAVSMSGRRGRRYVRRANETRLAPSVYQDERALRDWLLSLPRAWKGGLILPTTDAGVSFLSRHRPQLQERFHVSVPDWNRVEPLLDTRVLYAVAGQTSASLPWHLLPEDESEIHARRDEIPFPCIIKPGVSDRFAWKFKKKLFRVRCFEDLLAGYRTARREGIPVMISEIIPGGDDQLVKYCAYRDRNAEIIAALCLRKLRQHPPGFGVARASVTIPMIPELESASREVLDRTAYRGVCSAEYKYDHRDGRYKLIEINVRPQIQDRLLLHAGINFPFIAYLDWVENRSLRVHSYKEGLYWIDLWHDVVDYFRWYRGDRSPRRYFQPYWRDRVFRSPPNVGWVSLSGSAARSYGPDARVGPGG